MGTGEETLHERLSDDRREEQDGSGRVSRLREELSWRGECRWRAKGSGKEARIQLGRAHLWASWVSYMGSPSLGF